MVYSTGLACIVLGLNYRVFVLALNVVKFLASFKFTLTWNVSRSMSTIAGSE